MRRPLGLLVPGQKELEAVATLAAAQKAPIRPKARPILYVPAGDKTANVKLPNSAAKVKAVMAPAARSRRRPTPAPSAGPVNMRPTLMCLAEVPRPRLSSAQPKPRRTRGPRPNIVGRPTLFACRRPFFAAYALSPPVLAAQAILLATMLGVTFAVKARRPAVKAGAMQVLTALPVVRHDGKDTFSVVALAEPVAAMHIDARLFAKVVPPNMAADRLTGAAFPNVVDSCSNKADGARQFALRLLRPVACAARRGRQLTAAPLLPYMPASPPYTASRLL